MLTHVLGGVTDIDLTLLLEDELEEEELLLLLDDDEDQVRLRLLIAASGLQFSL